ncbi:MAG: AAA family ATPase, partial [Firmicutes bacterium]|nr:AAA family ATPase [Bacillota bacterium]
MRIREIRIEKLFGVFDHIIPLNMEDHITIIHGPNGYGKTNILRLIDAIFYLKYSVLYSIPFKNIEIDFDNDETLKIERLVNQENTITIRFSHIINGKNDENYFEVESDYYDEIIKNKDFDTIILPEAERAAQNTRWLSRKDYLYWKDGRDNTILNTIQVIEAYGNETILLNYKLVPEWLKQLISHEIRKIETDRLYRDPMQADTQKQMLTKTVLNTIFIFQNELIDLINKTRQEYAIYSQKLDSSFLLRLSGNGNEIASTDTQ